MGNFLMTMAEEKSKTRNNFFAVKYEVDEHDCFDFARALRSLGHDIFFVNWLDLSGAQFTRMFHYNARRFIEPLDLNEFDLIFIYKMEGFYFALKQFFDMVESFSQTHSNVINNPATIKHNIDKGYLLDLEHRGIRVIPTYAVKEIVLEQLNEGKRFVCKPIRGERGRNVFLAESVADLKVIEGQEHEYLAQEFMPEIYDGERSLVFLGLEYQHSVLKRPSDNDFRCNESLGGTVAVYDPTGEERDFAVNVLKAYESLGFPVHYSRVDLIAAKYGPVLVEAELINPSIYANYSKKGPEFGRSIANYFCRLVSAGRTELSSPV
jgi:glutathione synthase/RimK-type ligase-like ATP-grasp enzyme